jgi:hypothetical protein
MSKLYATLQADNRKEVTRRGHGCITAHLRGWDFGVRVIVTADKDGRVTATVERTGGSSGRTAPVVVLEMKEIFLGNEQDPGEGE